MSEESADPTELPPPKPPLRARLIILLIGGLALLGVVGMCIIVLVIIAGRT